MAMEGHALAIGFDSSRCRYVCKAGAGWLGRGLCQSVQLLRRARKTRDDESGGGGGSKQCIY